MGIDLVQQDLKVLYTHRHLVRRLAIFNVADKLTYMPTHSACYGLIFFALWVFKNTGGLSSAISSPVLNYPRLLSS